MTQGERIKELRKELEMTLDRFGERIGLKKAALSTIENGKCSVTDANIKSICREFNVNEIWLRTGEGEMFVQRTRNQIITDFAADLIIEQDDFKIRFIEGMAKLDEADWEDIKRIVDKITKKED